MNVDCRGAEGGEENYEEAAEGAPALGLDRRLQRDHVLALLHEDEAIGAVHRAREVWPSGLSTDRVLALRHSYTCMCGPTDGVTLTNLQL